MTTLNYIVAGMLIQSLISAAVLHCVTWRRPAIVVHQILVALIYGATLVAINLVRWGINL